ncbi:MAG: hypothetical protein AB1403_16185 [Candidatus Riflebacteria bacterium]
MKKILLVNAMKKPATVSNGLFQRYFLLLLFFSALTIQCFSAQTDRTIFKVPFKIGGQFYDYQNYHKIPYIHGGTDFCAPAGTRVFSPVSGQVYINSYQIIASSSPLQFTYIRRPFRRGETSNTRYLEVAVEDTQKNLWMFRHIAPNSVPPMVFTLAEKGLPVETGAELGQVGQWPVPVKPEPGNYHHIHVEILASDGVYLNPSQMLAAPKDYYAPEIHDLYFIDHNRNRLFKGVPHPVVRGRISIIAGITDRMNDSGYRHSVYSASLEIIRMTPRPETIRNRMVYNFDKLPFSGDRTQLASIIYRDRIEADGYSIFANGSDGPRFFLLNLTAGDVKRGYDSYNCLDTGLLSNGLYRCVVNVEDMAGNRRTAIQDFLVKN